MNEIWSTLIGIAIIALPTISAYITKWLKDKQLELQKEKVVNLEKQQLHNEKIVILNGMIADKMLVAQKLFTDNNKRLNYVLQYINDCLGRDFIDNNEKQMYIDRITRIKRQYNEMFEIKKEQEINV